MGRGVGQLDGALIFAVEAGLDPAGLRLHIVGLQTAHPGKHQAAVVLDAGHHRAQRVDMGQQQNGVFRAAQMGPDAALDGVFRRVAQAGQLFVHILLDLPGVAAGAVDGQKILQLLQHVILIFLFHKKLLLLM